MKQGELKYFLSQDLPVIYMNRSLAKGGLILVYLRGALYRASHRIMVDLSSKPSKSSHNDGFIISHHIVMDLSYQSSHNDRSINPLPDDKF